MKVEVANKKGIIKIPKHFASIEGIDKWGRFQYEVDFYANIPEVIKNDAYRLRVSVYTKDPISKTTMFSGVAESDKVIKNISDYIPRRKSEIKKARRGRIAISNADLTKGVSNTIAMALKRNPDAAVELLGYDTTYIAIDSQEANARGISAGANTSVAKGSENDQAIGYVARSIRTAALKMILKDGVDPSAIGEASFPINNPRDSRQGIGGKGQSQISKRRIVRSSSSTRDSAYGTHTDMMQSESNERLKRSVDGMTVRSKLRSTTGTSDSLQDVRSTSQIIESIVPRRWQKIEDDIRINPRRMRGKDELHFLFELIDSKGTIIDVKHRTVSHDAILEDYLTPDYPPRAKVYARRPGLNMVWIRQIDPVATAVVVYRKILNPSDPNISRKYQKIAKVNISRDDGYKRFYDRARNSSTCIYRFIPIGPRNKRGARFRGAVCKPFRPRINIRTAQLDLNHVSIFAEKSDEGITVRVTNIPEGPCALYVTRDDMTARGDRIVIGSSDPENQVSIVNESSIDIEITDTDVRDGHFYEYRVVMIYPNGKEEQSKVTELIEYRKDLSTEEGRVIITMSEPAVETDDNGISTAQFDITAELTDMGFGVIIDALEGAMIDQSYIDAVNNSRSEFNSLIAFEVLRQDSVSGETESFGVVQQGTFVDSNVTRTAAGVSNLSGGRSYRYLINVLMRSPESMFNQVEDEELDPETLMKFQRKFKKFLNPTTLRTGVTPSTARAIGSTKVSGIVPQDPFLEGKTSIQQTIDVNVPKQKATIRSITASRGRRNKNIIRWSITGNTDDLDHFIVMAYYQGVKSSIGTVHNISDSSNYKLVDLELSGQVGTVQYTVIPVYSDYTYGKESTQVSLTLDSDQTPDDTKKFRVKRQ